MFESTGSRSRNRDVRRQDGASNGASGGNTNKHRDPDGPEAERPRRVSGAAAVAQAKAVLMELTGQPCESVSSLSRTRDGWRVVLEVVELERIPRTTDIMASYLVELDQEGELMTYQRINRYYRNEVSGES